MNSRQKEIIQAELKNENDTIKALETVYKQAFNDCNAKIRELSTRTDLENIQSIVYQKQYQEAIKGQISGILTQLQSDGFATVSEYLNKCYNTGYVGNMYDLAGQGIPMILPINQNQVVKAIQNDSKLSKSLYQTMGEDVTYLKNAVKAQVSRGIANGSTWNEIADQMTGNFKNTPFQKAINNTIRIARTEGHRVQNQARMDSMKKAESKGANIVKQWNASLDGRTRDTHRRLDGQIRNIDEDFEIDGMTASAPAMFGIAEEDINCRCTMLQRAKWALSDDELDQIKDKADDVGLLEAKNYDDFEEKYLDASAKVESDKEDEEPVKVSVEDLDQDLQDRLYSYTNGQYSDICNYSQYIVDSDNMLHPKDWFEDNILPNISEADKETTEKLLEIIDNQPISDDTLYRLERFPCDAEVGDTITMGIRSATRDADFADKVFKSEMDGFDYDEKNFRGQWTEYRFEDSKSLDVSSISAYKDQQEELISGKYEVTKIEEIENIKGETVEQVKGMMKDLAENVEAFTSKSGKEMVRYTYDGKSMTDTVEKFNSREIKEWVDIEPQFGRKIVWLKIKE